MIGAFLISSFCFILGDSMLSFLYHRNAVSPLVTGVSGNAHARYPTWAKAIDAWHETCLPGNHAHPTNMQMPPNRPGHNQCTRSPQPPVRSPPIHTSAQYHTPPQTPRKPSAAHTPPQTTHQPPAAPFVGVKAPAADSPPPPTSPSSSELFGIRIGSPGRRPVVRIYEDR